MNQRLKRSILLLIMLGLTIVGLSNEKIKLLAANGPNASISKEGLFMLDGNSYVNFPAYGEVTYQVRLGDSGHGPVVEGLGYCLIEFTWDDDEMQTDPTLNTPIHFKGITTMEITFTTETVILHEMGEKDNDVIMEKPYPRAVLYFNVMFNIPYEFRIGVSGSDMIYNNIDHPFTLDEIRSKANIIVYDYYYGDLTSQLKIEQDNYSENKSKPGSFDILYSATNPSGLTAHYLLTIVNQDLTAPVVSGPNQSTIGYRQKIKDEDILTLYTVSDNWDHNVILKVDSTDYITNCVGSFTFTLVAKDMYDNKTTVYHTLIVEDDVNPDFNDSFGDITQVNYDVKYSDADLKHGLKAIDEIDGDISDRIKIVASNFQNGVIGVYNVIFSVSDNAGNTSEHTRIFEVITSYIPIFYVSKEIVYIKEGFELTIDQIAEEMARTANIILAKYEVIENDYSGNEAVEGQYKIVLKITDIYNEESYHAFLLEVFVPHYEDNDKPWYQFIIDIGRWIYNNIIRHIINFFIVIWNYTVGLIFESARLEYLFRV